MGRNRTRKWIPEEEAYLLAAKDEGYTNAQLAERLERSPQAIQKRYRQLRPAENLADLWQRYQTALTGQQSQSPFHGGHREDLGVTVRSRWEANVARWFTFHGIDWEFEPRLFEFDKIKRGTKTYLPDFWLPSEGRWVEVKGYLRSADKTKLRRFRKYYPIDFSRLKAIPKNPRTDAARFFEEVDIPILAYYDDIAEESHLIPNWE